MPAEHLREWPQLWSRSVDFAPQSAQVEAGRRLGAIRLRQASFAGVRVGYDHGMNARVDTLSLRDEAFAKELSTLFDKNADAQLLVQLL